VKSHIPQKLPITGLDWAALAPFTSRANMQLGYYSGTLDALYAPSIYYIPMMTQEAVFSSRIEGTQADYEEVVGGEALPDLDPEKRDDVQEVINYRRAMQYALAQMEEKPLNLNLIRQMHSILLDGVRGKRKGRGEFRRVQNWIGGATMETARYVPPPVEMLDDLLNNWEAYLHACRPGEEQPPHLLTERDPLVQLAVLHAQFEIIHPFVDGNGRIGRMIIPLFLYQHDLISRPVFTLSAYIDAHRSEYYDRLNAVTAAGAWTDWIVFFLTAIGEQAAANSQQARQIVNLFDTVTVRVNEATRSQYAAPAVEIIFEQPIFTTSDFVERLGAPRRSAIDLLNNLKEAGIITVIKAGSGQRPETLAFVELLKLMK